MQLGYHRIRLKLAKLTQPLAFMKSWGAMATNQTVNPLNLLQEKRLIMLKKFVPGEQKEVRTPSGKRMDRYDREKAHIREIKPDNPRGERSGKRALANYKTEMDNATGKSHTTELTKYKKDQ